MFSGSRERKSALRTNGLRIGGLKVTGKKKNLLREILWQRTNNSLVPATSEQVEKEFENNKSFYCIKVLIK